MFCIHAQSYWLDPLIKGNIFWVKYDVSYKYRKMDVIVIENLGEKKLLATVFMLVNDLKTHRMENVKLERKHCAMKILTIGKGFKLTLKLFDNFMSV